MAKIIYIGSDHGGFKLKKKLVTFLEKENYLVEDMGPLKLNSKDDYPDYASKVAKKVTHETNSRGILLCRNGQGVCIAANKIKGIRAVTGFSQKMIKSTRLDDNANVLCLPADYITEKEAKRIVSTFLKTKYSQLKRHKRRLMKVARLEI